jgi:hypothetical protein
MRVISPAKEHFPSLRTALTAGELTVFTFFDELLDEKWEIYVQPHLNGLRPDFVLLNPNVGIAVYEVKDWNLAAMQYQTRERKDKSPELMATDRNGRTFSLQHDNPVERIRRYQNEIFNLYCPRLEAKSGISAITAGVIFPFATTEEVKRLLGPCYKYWHKKGTISEKYHPIAGRDLLEARAITSVFPNSQWRTSMQMTPELAKDLRHWLVEPDFAA